MEPSLRMTKQGSARACAPRRSVALVVLLLSVSFHGTTAEAPATSEFCPDVSSCMDVCGAHTAAGQFHASHCSTKGGVGQYTAACCAGTGLVCAQPPCKGAIVSTKATMPQPASPPTATLSLRDPAGEHGGEDGERARAKPAQARSKQAMIAPTLPDLLSGPESRHEVAPMGHLTMPLRHLLPLGDGARPLRLGFEDGAAGRGNAARDKMHRLVSAVTDGGVDADAGAPPGERPCSHKLTIHLRREQRSAGLRDELLVLSTDTYTSR